VLSRLTPLAFLGTLLAIAAIARMGALVLHEPLLGAANQYDMIRTGACVGIYPDLPAETRDGATSDAPRDRYRLDAPMGSACYPGTEAAIAGAVAVKQRLFGTPSEPFRALREVGLVKLALAGLAILALCIGFYGVPAAAMLHGLTALVVLADPVVTLWFQSLYAEFPVIFGLYLLVGALVAGMLREGLPTWLAILAGTGIAMCAFAKEQFSLLPLALVAVATPRLWRTSRRAVLVLLALAALAAPWHALMPRPETIAQANRANAYLGLLLPAGTNTAATAARLGLPERCAELSGATWYLPRGEDLRTACPEALRLSSLAFLRLVPTEPATLARAAVRVLPTTQNPLPGNLGVVAGASFGSLATEPLWVRSVLQWAALKLPAVGWLALSLIGIAALFPALVLWGATLARGANADAHPFACYTLMLAMILLYALGTTTFGDGLSESARHNLPGFVAGCTLALAVPFALDRPGRVGPWLASAALVASLAAIAAALAATAWALRQPIAIGALDAPTTREVPREGFAVRGWALDLSGVQAIRVHAGSSSWTIAREAMLPTPDLARVHGGYPGAHFGGFELGIPAAALAGPEILLRVEVQSETGVVTELDRRRVRPAP
jgi:hypothetical protein